MKKITAFLSMLGLTFVLGMTIFGQIKIAPLELKQRALSNGLRIISVRDNASPTVSVHVWYDVGGKNDPPGRSGFAHLFEHMMFKSTKNMKSEMMDRLTEDVGGFNNASTWDDYTNYYEVVPSNYLESILWAEADRMINLDVDEKNFASERKVVQEEFRQGVLSQPYGRFFEYINSLSYEKHPYRRGVIGNLEELEAATNEDARRFYQTYYRPDNAWLIVVGDFDQAQLDGWIDKYFGKIPKPSGEIPRVSITEPERGAEKRYAKTAPNVPFPAVAITFLAPDSKSPDVAALKIADTILSNGESSRLYQALIYEQQIAQEANFQADIRHDRGLLYFFAIASGKTAPAQLEKSLLAELKKMQDAPVSAKELEKAKNKRITDALQALETNDGKAIAIELAIAYQGDPQAVNAEIAKLQAVTAADVQRVMKKYFSDKNRLILYYQQEEEKK